MNFERERIKSSPWGYSDTFILVAGDIINIIVNAENYTDVVFNNCAPFSTCKTEINDIFYWWSKLHLHCNAYVQIKWI